MRYELNHDGDIVEYNGDTQLIANPQATIIQLFSQGVYSCNVNSRDGSYYSISITNNETGEVDQFDVYYGNIRNESRDPKEKKIQLNGKDPRTATRNPLIIGAYCFNSNDPIEELIIAAWGVDHTVNYPSNPSIRGINIDLFQEAKVNGIIRNDYGSNVVCVFRPEFLFTYLNNRREIYNGEVDVNELIGEDHQTEIKLEEAFETGDMDLRDIVSLPTLANYTKEQFAKLQEQFEEKGLEGEEKLNAYFLNQQSEGVISEYEWTSNINPFSPFDFKFIENGEQVYVDAKTTTGGFNRQLFVSGNELKMILHNDNYFIYRIYRGEDDTVKARKSSNLKEYVIDIFNSFQTLPDGVDVKNISINPSALNFEVEEIEL